MRISKQLRAAVKSTVSDLFEKAKARLSGRFYGGKHIFLEVFTDFSPENSLEGVFRHAYSNLIGPLADLDTEPVSEQTQDVDRYLETLKHKTEGKVLEAFIKGDEASLEEALSSATQHFETILETEAKKTQNLAAMDGVLEVGKSVGVEDPVVFWRGRVDGKLCKKCRSMYHCESNIMIPRVTLMSKVKPGYLKYKEWQEGDVYLNAHARCRHSMSIILPGYGFSPGGSLEFMGGEHSELDAQLKRGDTI